MSDQVDLLVIFFSSPLILKSEATQVSNFKHAIIFNKIKFLFNSQLILSSWNSHNIILSNFPFQKMPSATSYVQIPVKNVNDGVYEYELSKLSYEQTSLCYVFHMSSHFKICNKIMNIALILIGLFMRKNHLQTS